MIIQFDVFSEQHIPLFRKWLNQDHIKQFWQESEDDNELRDKFLIRLPKRGIYCFVFKVNENLANNNIENKMGTSDSKHPDKPNTENNYAGFIQYYEASKIGGGWWDDEKPGSYGIDLMIGDPNQTGKGLGPQVIQEFMKFIISREKNVTSFIIDPEPKNLKGIRAFEKAGFVKEKELVTPNGPTMLMRMKVK